MSAYVEGTVEFQDKECLIAALTKMSEHWHRGWSKDQIEEHEEGAQLIGYMGDKREDTAHVIIRRRYLSTASNDMGFRKVGNAYVPIISEYDSRVYNQSFLNTLKQVYGVEKAVKQATKRGYKTTVTRVGDKLKVTCTKR